MSISVELNGPGIDKLIAYCRNPMNKTEGFFKNLAAYFDQQTKLTFRSSGARAGHAEWAPLKLSTILTRVGTRKIRYGTDMKGLDKGELTELKRKWGWGHVGMMRKGVRRYDTDSKPLQASGSFMRSFGPLYVDRLNMVYGSTYHSVKGVSAGEIAGKREVLFITAMDRMFIKNSFKIFFEEAMRNS